MLPSCGDIWNSLASAHHMVGVKALLWFQFCRLITAEACETWIFIFIGTPLKGQQKLISMDIGAAVSLFITDAHEIFSLSSFIELSSISSDAWQSGEKAQRTARSLGTDSDDSYDSESVNRKKVFLRKKTAHLRMTNCIRWGRRHTPIMFSCEARSQCTSRAMTVPNRHGRGRF